MVEEAKKLLNKMHATRAIATVSYLRSNAKTMDIGQIQAVLQAASGPLRRGGATSVFLDAAKVCLDQDMFDEEASVLSLSGGHSVLPYQCILLNPNAFFQERDKQHLKTNTVVFNLCECDFAIIQHMPNYFEVVTRIDPIFQALTHNTPEEERVVKVQCIDNISFVHDDSYDSIIVPLVAHHDNKLRVVASALLVVESMTAVKDDCIFGDSMPFACRAI